MANIETTIQNRIRLELSKAGAVTFRNMTAQGWAGKIVDQGAGYVTLSNPSPLIAGLCVGSPDLVGWMPVTVTPDMVGRRIAVFLCPEIKTPIGRASPEQLKFYNAAIRGGAIAGFPTTEAEAVAMVQQWLASR